MNKVVITGVDTSKLGRLKNDEMNELLARIANGDQVAREKMINNNLKLILSVLKKFQNRNEDMDDLFQVGTIGLIKAVDNFDLKHGVRFSTYAVPMIIGEIRRHLRDNSPIRVSRSLKDIAYKAIPIKEKYLREFHREPTPQEIAKELEVEPINVIMALEAIQEPISMFTPIYDNGGDVIELIDQIGDDANDEEVFFKEKLLFESIKKLNPREKDIIKKRYFIKQTQTEIAQELNISQAQVSRLEKTALKTMLNFIKAE